MSQEIIDKIFNILFNILLWFFIITTVALVIITLLSVILNDSGMIRIIELLDTVYWFLKKHTKISKFINMCFYGGGAAFVLKALEVIVNWYILLLNFLVEIRR